MYITISFFYIKANLMKKCKHQR